MKTNFAPRTRLGKWSVGFGAVFAAYFFLVSPVLMALNQRLSGEEGLARDFLIAIGLSAMASGLLAFFTGIVSFIKYQERSVFIYLATLIGLLAVAFLLGEFLFPH